MWLPYYYAALVKSRMSMQGLGGDKDKVADEAEALLNKAEAIEKTVRSIVLKYDRHCKDVGRSSESLHAIYECSAKYFSGCKKC